VFDFHALFSAEGLVSLISLTVMEIVLGIDNVLLVAILSQKVKPAHRKRVRQLGIGLALVLRIGLLFTLTWLMGLRNLLVAPLRLRTSPLGCPASSLLSANPDQLFAGISGRDAARRAREQPHPKPFFQTPNRMAER